MKAGKQQQQQQRRQQQQQRHIGRLVATAAGSLLPAVGS
jgi:hypothetical protein